MAQVKMIYYSNEEESKEGVIFLELPDTSNQNDEDYIPAGFGCFIKQTVVLDIELHKDFPLGYRLDRE